MLQISVWNNKELSVLVPVRPDGRITVPLIGDLRAHDLTPSELSTVIEEGLRHCIQNPVVDVIVTKVNNPRVYVIGNGLVSGEYVLNSETTLVQLLARLGNIYRETLKKGKMVTHGPDYHHTYLLRQGMKIKESFHELFIDGDMSQDISLKAGDIIYIPDNVKNNVKIVGSVRKPGVITYRVTALDAILAAGGFDEFAKESEVVIVRSFDTEKKEITVNMKDVIKRGKVDERIGL